jgi:lysophospholipase L1-like esterase
MRSTTVKLIAASLTVALVLAGVSLLVAPRASANDHVEQAAACTETPTVGWTDHRLLLVVGASFTAGIGPDNPSANWAVRLGQLLDWRAVTYGVPGEGYSSPGVHHLGPLLKLFYRIDLASLHPDLIIVQAGHNDWRVPPALEAHRVAALVRYLRGEAPYARLAFLTAFSGAERGAHTSRWVSRANSTIVRAIKAADPNATIINPYDWRFPRAADGLHPTAGGDSVIAHRVLHVLTSDGLPTTPVTTPAVQSSAKVSCSALERSMPASA